jgi:hypothetical protein
VLPFPAGGCDPSPVGGGARANPATPHERCV